jgi:hypothetical protein
MRFLPDTTITDLLAQTEAQAANLDALNIGSNAWKLTRVAGALLPSLVVPTGAGFTHYPFAGSLELPEPPDVGIWSLNEAPNIDGVIRGSNDVASRYAMALTVDYADDALAAVQWQILFARGTTLATAPVFTADRVLVSGRTGVLAVGEPDGRSMTGLFTHPSSGNATEYAMFVSHNQPGNVTFIPASLTVLYASIGPGTFPP